MTQGADVTPNNLEELISNPLGGLPDPAIDVSREQGDEFEDRPVCPRIFELWVRFDELNDERKRKEVQSYATETDRVVGLAQVDQAIATVRSALDGSSVGSAVEESSDTLRKHQQNAARAKAEKARPRIEACRQRIIAAWLSGNFATRDACAEQEAEAIGINFLAARRHLYNTPDPDPWPAKSAK